MSRSASINIEIEEGPPALRLLDTLVEAGWEFYRMISYLPLGDVDMFEWVNAPIEAWPEVQETLAEKARRGETVGIDLRWRDGWVGGSFLFYPGGTLHVLLSGDRPRLVGCEPVTDFSWFLTRLIPPLVKSGVAAFSVRCADLG